LLSCLSLPIELQGREIVTVEGLAEDGQPHPLQVAFAELGASQCGYCSPGILVTAKALLDRNPAPTRDEVREAISGNICRCTGYSKILDAIERAAGRMQVGIRGQEPGAAGHGRDGRDGDTGGRGDGEQHSRRMRAGTENRATEREMLPPEPGTASADVAPARRPPEVQS
jgi:hypothetical protein